MILSKLCYVDTEGKKVTSQVQVAKSFFKGYEITGTGGFVFAGGPMSYREACIFSTGKIVELNCHGEGIKLLGDFEYLEEL